MASMLSVMDGPSRQAQARRVGPVTPLVGQSLDWTEGTLLQISGRATLDWSPAAAAGFAGALRVVHLAIDAVQQTEHAVALSWTPAVLNSHNPPRATRPRPVRQVHGG